MRKHDWALYIFVAIAFIGFCFSIAVIYKKNHKGLNSSRLEKLMEESRDDELLMIIMY